MYRLIAVCKGESQASQLCFMSVKSKAIISTLIKDTGQKNKRSGGHTISNQHSGHFSEFFSYGGEKKC